MYSRYNITKDSFTKEFVDDDPADFPKERKKGPSKYYENHLQKIGDDYLRYCYYDVKLDGRRIYGQRGPILPESLAVKLHLKAIENGVLTPKLWIPFAKKILARDARARVSNYLPI